MTQPSPIRNYLSATRQQSTPVPVGGLTADQVRDLVGAMFDGFAAFTYDSQTRTLAFVLTDPDIPADIARDTEVDAEVKAEARLRTEGDDIQAIVIASNANLTSALTAQAGATTALIAEVTADVVVNHSGSRHAYNAGDVLYFAPKSISGETLFSLRDPRVAALDRALKLPRIRMYPESIKSVNEIAGNYEVSLDNVVEEIFIGPDPLNPYFPGISRFKLTEISNDRPIDVHNSGWLFAGAEYRFNVEISDAEAKAIFDQSPDTFLVFVGEFSDRDRSIVIRTNEFTIPIGDVEGFPSTREEAALEVKAREDGDRVRLDTVKNAAELVSALTAQKTSTRPLILDIEAAVTTAFDGATHTYAKGDIAYFPPLSANAEGQISRNVMSGDGVTEQRVAALIEAHSKLPFAHRTPPPFASIKLLPLGLPDATFPANYFVVLEEKQITREISGLALSIAGQPLALDASTPITVIDTERRAILQFNATNNQRETLGNNATSNVKFYQADLTFSFTEGADVVYRLAFPVNNAGVPAGGDVDLSGIEKKIADLEERSPTSLSALTYAANLAINWNDGKMRSVTLTGNTTISFSNVSAGDVLVLEVTQDSTGSRTITWPSSVEWPSGSAEGPSDGGGDVDVFTLLALSSTRIVASALLDVS